MAFHNLASKLDRAIVAYLISKGAGTEADTFPAKRSQDKDVPQTVVYTKDLAPLDGDVNSGTREASVEISITYDVVNPDGTQTARKASDERTADVFDALNTQGQSTDLLCDAINAAAWARAEANPDDADLADFSAIGIAPNGESQGFIGDKGAWTDIIKLKIICCPSNRA